MLKKLFLGAMLATFGMGSLAATNAADYEPTNGQWRVFGEYLYWSPSVDDTYFVIENDVGAVDSVQGKRKNNDFDFYSGYRVGGAYLFCDCNRELQVSYANLQFNQSKTVDGDFLWATVGHPDMSSDFEDYTGSAKSRLKFWYQNVDAFFAQQIYDCCNLSVAVQFGLEAVELKLNERYTYTDTVNNNIGEVNRHCRTNAIGPKVGLAFGYELYKGDSCGCPGTLTLNVLSAGSLLAADTKVKMDSVETQGTAAPNTFLDISDKKDWRVIPAFHARAGLSYDMSFDCIDASIEVGYEFTSYIRGLSRAVFPDNAADGLSWNNYNNFDLQGLYVQAALTF